MSPKNRQQESAPPAHRPSTLKSTIRVLAPRPYLNRKSRRPKEDSHHQPCCPHGRVGGSVVQALVCDDRKIDRVLIVLIVSATLGSLCFCVFVNSSHLISMPRPIFRYRYVRIHGYNSREAEFLSKKFLRLQT